ncbi:MAG: hypothetical protein ACOCWB_08505 [Bacteroidota bacterium]
MYHDVEEHSERIMEAFDTMNALSMSDKISQYIQFEPRKAQGTEHLFGVLHAIFKLFEYFGNLLGTKSFSFHNNSLKLTLFLYF